MNETGRAHTTHINETGKSRASQVRHVRLVSCSSCPVVRETCQHKCDM